MALTRQLNKKPKASPMRKVQTGRIGKSLPTKSKSSQANAGKELFLDNQGKELFPQLLKSTHAQGSLEKRIPSRPSSQSAESTKWAVHFTKHFGKQRYQQQRQKRPQRASARRKAKSLEKTNTRLRLLKASKDGTAKRLSALQNEISYKPPFDARDKDTVPYAQASLDHGMFKNSLLTLNIQIACSFGGYEATCTPSKVYSFRLDGFSDLEKLKQLIFHSQDTSRAMKQMGVNLTDRNVEIVGYEVRFPRGLRYRVAECMDTKRHEQIEYLSRPSNVLVNMPCALREFWLQARDYASDKQGNISIPVIARLGLKEVDHIWGGEQMLQFTKEWRSNLEKKWLVEERRIDLDRKQLATGDEQKRIAERMRAIEEAADKAMQQSGLFKEILDTCSEKRIIDMVEEDPNDELLEELQKDEDFDLDLFNDIMGELDTMMPEMS